MDRRKFLEILTAIPLFSKLVRAETSAPFRRVRPGDAAWPSEAKWQSLNNAVGGRLIKVESPLAACKGAPNTSCDEIFKALKNPYYIGDQPGLTQTSGWVDAWTSKPSVYAVAAENTQDVIAAVNFARENNLRFVVKGGGHSYQGTSSAPDSLLIWTRKVNKSTMHDAFVGKGCDGKQKPQPAVTVEAGAMWMQVYDAVTTKAGRYVQGGGCATVGVAGLIQSGGFGSHSKNYGLAAAALLEAEVVTADGVARIANACTNSELFWGLKGGGGGSLGVVTRLTLRTRELPEFFGAVLGIVKAKSDRAYRTLIAHAIQFYAEHLFNPHWGEQITFLSGNRLRFSLVCQGLDQKQIESLWRPFREWLAAAPGDYAIEEPMQFVAFPAQRMWDYEFMNKTAPGLMVADDRPGTRAGNVFWAPDGDQVGQFMHGYRSAWLPARLLNKTRRAALGNALFACSRYWEVSLHFNKGLAGAPAAEIAAARDTAINPAVLDAFALAIIASHGPPASPGLAGHEPDVAAARDERREIDRAMNVLLKTAPGAGSYVSESDFFERDWQRSYWGSNYSRLAAVKKKYDPEGLFFVHHGVGSEGWSADGFERLKVR